ncbi:MAG: hypothetical protein PHP59_12620, partial [Methanofollis sp.]|uniref:hypothetical protein n=1 Tax=Methanofollis sp. TaxID=2052835 RepID=UPI002620FFE1
MLENPMTWVYLTFALLGVVVILIVALVAGYILLKPVAIPYLQCRGKSKTTMMQIFQQNGVERLVPGKYVSGMYEDPDPQNPLAFFKSDTGSYKLGACNTELFYDGAVAATSPDLVVAAQELWNMGYRNIDDLMKAVRAGAFKGDQFTLKGEVVCFDNGTISIPLIRQFDPARIEIFSKGKPAITKAYSDTKLNIDRR